MRKLVATLAGAVVPVVVSRVAKGFDTSSWDRASYSGRVVSLIGGLGAAAGTVISSSFSADRKAAVGGCIAASTAAVAGYIDDHCEGRFPARGKGFAGHLGALKEGRITSGLMKILVIGSGALGASIVTADSSQAPAARSINVVTNTALIATTANLINLLDLRPGRALKVVSAIAAPIALSHSSIAPVTAGLVGTCASSAPADLRGETMLGDLGANALGAQLGLVFTQALGFKARLTILAGVMGLTALSEKVSFSQVIENNSVLRAIDNFGR